MEDIIKNLEQGVARIEKDFRNELSGIRTGRANALLVENIQAESYGTKMALKQLGSISVVPPKEINIQIWDQGLVDAVIKAIENSSLKLTPKVDGNVIHINLPPLTQERRQELIKHISKLAEERKISIRMLRDEANKKAKVLPVEDDQFKAKDNVQEIVNVAIKQIDYAIKAKTDEINE